MHSKYSQGSNSEHLLCGFLYLGKSLSADTLTHAGLPIPDAHICAHPCTRIPNIISLREWTCEQRFTYM